MPDAISIMTRQAEWQLTRARLSWAEKVHAAERLRQDVQCLQAGAKARVPSPAPRHQHPHAAAQERAHTTA